MAMAASATLSERQAAPARSLGQKIYWTLVILRPRGRTDGPAAKRAARAYPSLRAFIEGPAMDCASAARHIESLAAAFPSGQEDAPSDPDEGCGAKRGFRN